MHASLRASDADREQLIDVLKAAFAEGRLSQDEYTARMERAYASRTYGELRVLVSDLPAAAPQVPYAFTKYRQQPGTNSLAVASLICGLFGITAIPAVILGHKARRQIRQTGERGAGMAIAGQVLGWTTIGLFALLVALTVLLSVAYTAHSGSAVPGSGGLHVGAGVQLMPDIRIWPHAAGSIRR